MHAACGHLCARTLSQNCLLAGPSTTPTPPSQCPTPTRATPFLAIPVQCSIALIRTRAQRRSGSCIRAHAPRARTQIHNVHNSDIVRGHAVRVSGSSSASGRPVSHARRPVLLAGTPPSLLPHPDAPRPPAQSRSIHTTRVGQLLFWKNCPTHTHTHTCACVRAYVLHVTPFQRQRSHALAPQVSSHPPPRTTRVASHSSTHSTTTPSSPKK